MSDSNEDDPLSGILGDELGEWDKMFDSLHETAKEGAPAALEDMFEFDPLSADPPTPVVPVDAEAIDSAAVAAAASVPSPGEEPPTPAIADILDFALEDAADVVEPQRRGTVTSELDRDVGFTLGPPGAVDSEGPAETDDELSLGVPEALGSLLGSEGAELDFNLEEQPEAVATPEAFAEPALSTEEDLARLADSANAFFEERDVTAAFELDDDFYDGIEIGSGAIPTPIPEDEPMESVAYEVQSTSERATPVVGVVVTADAIADPAVSTAVVPGPDAVAAVANAVVADAVAVAVAVASDNDQVSEDWSFKAGSLSVDGSDGVPQPIPEQGHGALRTGATRAESEDSLELASEVEGALESIRTGPSTPAPSDSEDEENVELEAVAGSVVLASLAEPVLDEEQTVDMAPLVPPVLAGPEVVAPTQNRLDGVVDAALDDAVAMSTGTLHTGPQLLEADVEPDLPDAIFSGVLPDLDLSRIHVDERVEADTSNRSEEVSKLLVLYERELTSLDEPGAVIRFRIESGRLAEGLGDLDRARRHLDEALKLDPRLVPANRALRRIERRLGNWDQVLSQLDNERLKAGAMEGRALAAYRADLLIAISEPDLARVAVGELLDTAPNDTRALLANLELAFVDGREDEVREALVSLADTLSGPRLRSAISHFEGALAAGRGERDVAEASFLKVEAAHPNLGAQIVQSALRAPATDVSVLAAAVGKNNAEVGAGVAVLAAESLLADGDVETARGLLGSVGQVVASQPLARACMARVASEADALRTWQSLAASNTDEVGRSWSLAQAVQLAVHSGQREIALSHAEEALAASPTDSFAQRWVRRLGGVAATAAADTEGQDRDASAAFAQAEMLVLGGDVSGAQGAIDKAFSLAEAPHSPSLRAYALELAHFSDDAAAICRHATALAEDAGSDEVALPAKRIVARSLSRQAAAETGDSLKHIGAAEAWRTLSDVEPGLAAENAFIFARASDDTSAVADYASLAGEQARYAGRSQELALWFACQMLREDPVMAADALAGALLDQSNPHALELFWSVALSTERVGEAAEALEREVLRATEGSARIDRYRYRSAFVRVHHDIDTDLAAETVEALVRNRPAFSAAAELLASIRGFVSTGHREPAHAKAESTPNAALPHDAISSEVRSVEALARCGSVADAAEQSARLLQKYAGDALVEHCFSRYNWLAGASAELAAFSLAELRRAEELGDSEGKARACEELARIDLELRGDRDSARMFWESASNADPGRADLQRLLEAEYRGDGEQCEQRRAMIGRVIACLPAGVERSAYLVARARLSAVLEREAAVVRSDYEAALGDDAECREALFCLEAEASGAGPTEALAALEAKVSQYFVDDPRARAAFLVRSGETWRILQQREPCLARLKAALQVVPGFSPALSAWRDLALDYELWDELAEACLLEAESVESDETRSNLFLLAGVTLMDKVANAERAILALRKVLIVAPHNREAFVRLRQLYIEREDEDELAQLFSMRLNADPESVSERCELHLSLARVLRKYLKNDSEALLQYRALLELRPNDLEAVSAVADISWATEKWADAAEALMVLARIEDDEDVQVSVFSRLGTIYAEHLPEPSWALKSFHKVATLQPGNREALRSIAALGPQVGEFRLALGACEQLIKQEPPVAERIDILVSMARILVDNVGDANQAERALRHALDLDPASDVALDALVSFYIDRKDLRSARVHVDRVANAMRKRIAESAIDGEAYRVLARAMAAKANAGATECMPTAQVAATLALKLGSADDETAAIAKRVGAGVCEGLAGETFDDLLFPANYSGAARTLFSLLGGRLAKHIGIDIRPHGVGRSDRLRKGIDESAGTILQIAAEMGIEDVDIYVSKSKPKLAAVEPTSPFSLILGSELATTERPAELRFLVGRSLKGAASSLSAPLQLGRERFGVLLVGLLRQFQSDFAPAGVDTEAAAAEQQRLRRLIPSNLLQELQPYALGLATSDFDHRKIWYGLTEACNRAGLVCAGDGSAAIAGLMRSKGLSNLKTAVEDAEIAGLIRFACSAEHSRLWAAVRA